MIPFAVIIAIMIGLWIGAKGWAHHIKETEETDKDLN